MVILDVIRPIYWDSHELCIYVVIYSRFEKNNAMTVKTSAGPNIFAGGLDLAHRPLFVCHWSVTMGKIHSACQSSAKPEMKHQQFDSHIKSFFYFCYYVDIF